MGVFSKLAGGGVTKALGVALMVLTIIPAVIKAFSVTTPTGKVTYLIWRGKAIVHGHFMYPIRDFSRVVGFRPKMERLVKPPKPRTQGRSWYIPIWGHMAMLETTDRHHDTTVVFYRQDEKLNSRLRFTAELQIVFGLISKPIPNPWFIPPDLDEAEMAAAVKVVEEEVGRLKGDIVKVVHEPFIYPWTALFNPDRYEPLSQGVMKQAIMSTYSDPGFAESNFRDSVRVYDEAEQICRNRLLLLYATELREIRISDVSNEAMQTEPIAAALNKAADAINGLGQSPNRAQDQDAEDVESTEDTLINGVARVADTLFHTS